MNTSTQYYLQFLTKLLLSGLFVRKTFYNFIHELQYGGYAKNVHKINMKTTPTYIDGKMNKKADDYYQTSQYSESRGIIMFY